MNNKMKKFLVAATLCLSVAGVSRAGNVYVTGSTAMRSTFYNAIIQPGACFVSAPTVTLYQGGTTGNNAGSGASLMAFSGTLVGGSGTTVIKCAWSGSEAGIKDVSTGVSENFIADSALNGADNGTNSPSATESHAVDLAMADSSQDYSRTPSPVLNQGTQVGVITFEWVRNPGKWTGSNVTDSQIRQAFGGFCPLAVFSGNAADTGSFVYVSGRDNLSGTRVNAYGTSGFGIFSSPKQIEINTSGVMQQVGGLYKGDFGYTSGGTLAKTMGANTTAQTDLAYPTHPTGFSVIAYVGISDGNTAVANGATVLTLNGVPFSSAAIKEGTYNFWGNEYIYAANSIGSEAQIAYNNLSNPTTGISHYCDGISAIDLTQMNCSRTGPDTDPVHN
jgi:hypothetical protein